MDEGCECAQGVGSCLGALVASEGRWGGCDQRRDPDEVLSEYLTGDQPRATCVLGDLVKLRTPLDPWPFGDTA